VAPTPHDIQTLENLVLREGVIVKGIENKKLNFYSPLYEHRHDHVNVSANVLFGLFVHGT